VCAGLQKISFSFQKFQFLSRNRALSRTYGRHGAKKFQGASPSPSGRSFEPRRRSAGPTRRSPGGGEASEGRRRNWRAAWRVFFDGQDDVTITFAFSQALPLRLHAAHPESGARARQRRFSLLGGPKRSTARPVASASPCRRWSSCGSPNGLSARGDSLLPRGDSAAAALPPAANLARRQPSSPTRLPIPGSSPGRRRESRPLPSALIPTAAGISCVEKV
jgi:hypothetical protein